MSTVTGQPAEFADLLSAFGICQVLDQVMINILLKQQPTASQMLGFQNVTIEKSPQVLNRI